MSEYFLADLRAQERARQREQERARELRDQPRRSAEPRQAQDVKITLLGDFMIPSQEPQGFDPYNATQGKAARDAWKLRRDRR